MYKVERKAAQGPWYEVMLSPFNTKDEVISYYHKYSKHYPIEEKVYRVTNLKTNRTKQINENVDNLFCC
jgi:hypothetical protein